MSVYKKFLDKNKSKLCESKSKKVSLRKLTRVNESDAYEKGYLDESCGKRKPRKPFPRKSLKESAKEDYQQLKDTLSNSDSKWKVYKDKYETNYTFKTKKVEITIGTGDELEEKYGSPYVAFVTIKTPNKELEDTYVGDTLKKVKEKVLNNSLVSQYLSADMKSVNESKKEREEYLKKTFDDFQKH